LPSFALASIMPSPLRHNLRLVTMPGFSFVIARVFSPFFLTYDLRRKGINIFIDPAEAFAFVHGLVKGVDSGPDDADRLLCVNNSGRPKYLHFTPVEGQAVPSGQRTVAKRPVIQPLKYPQKVRLD
jgi:hypothetical protein